MLTFASAVFVADSLVGLSVLATVLALASVIFLRLAMRKSGPINVWTDRRPYLMTGPVWKLLIAGVIFTLWAVSPTTARPQMAATFALLAAVAVILPNYLLLVLAAQIEIDKLSNDS